MAHGRAAGKDTMNPGETRSRHGSPRRAVSTIPADASGRILRHLDPSPAQPATGLRGPFLLKEVLNLALSCLWSLPLSRDAGLFQFPRAAERPVLRGRFQEGTAALAEGLRRLKERTNAGIQTAKANGVKFGRPQKLTEAQRAEIVRRVNATELTAADAARLFQVDSATISRLLRHARSVDSA